MFRVANSGCSASNPVQRDWQSGYRRSLRYRIEMVEKLADDWGGTTRGSFRIGGILLVNGYTTPYMSAEIPPAGAPSGFDFAAFLSFIA